MDLAIQSGRIVDLADADAGTNGIPPTAAATGWLASTTVTNGVIIATGTADVGSNTYSLTPTLTVPVQWTEGGTCINIGLC